MFPRGFREAAERLRARRAPSDASATSAAEPAAPPPSGPSAGSRDGTEAEGLVAPLIDRLITTVRHYNPAADAAVLRKACVWAAAAHAGQTRKSGEPYITHPLAAAMIAAELRLDVASVITAVLHDTVEDTGLTLGDIREGFGGDVAGLVDGVTKLKQVSRARGSSSQAENLQKFVLAIAADVRVLLVKLCDRLHNMRTLASLPAAKRERKARETLEIYAPLARRIGVHRICGELEDLSFQWVNPGAFESVTTRLAAARAERAPAVAEVSAAVTESLADAGIPARVFGREKRAYSIWRKLERRNVEFEDLADVYAFRIIARDVDACYRALGVVHQRWRCVPERFKDFISTPKPNNYRSIHTTILGPDQRRVELQIRTEMMDRVAEDGVAAHWRYKDATYAYDDDAALEGGRGGPAAQLHSLVEILEHATDPEEFLENAKLEMFADQVFTFTPKGDVIALPAGATPLDFAYAVHTAVGDTCVGAKINGRQRPLRTRLDNGDVVEIIRSGVPAPPPGWEDIAVTGRARSGIRRLIRRAEREEFARVGRAIAEYAFRKEGLELESADLTEALARLEFSDDEALYADMGRGRTTGRELIQAVYPGLRPTTGPEEDAPRDVIGDDTARMFVSGRGLTPGVCLHFANCCSPLPGDRIVGIVRRDKGVEIHTIDCDVLEAMDEEAGDWIDIGWTAAAAARAVSVARVAATVRHERGVLAEIATAVTMSDGNITGLRLTRRAVDFFEMVIDIEVRDARHLSHIVAALRACPSVVSAERARGRDGGGDANPCPDGEGDASGARSEA